MKEWSRPVLEMLDAKQTLAGGTIKQGDLVWVDLDDGTTQQLGSS